MKRVKTLIILFRYYSSFVNRDVLNIYLGHGKDSHVPADGALGHLKAAAQWICRAQDASDDGGVARSFSLIFSPYFKCRGWVPSYPETTGYIIPTMFDYAGLVGSQVIFDRAVRMTDWECEVQMESGAVQGGTVDQEATPAIFNTGQVIFGWTRAFQETRREKYLNAAIRAGNFLVQNQDKDGAWRRQLSAYTSHEMPFYTYNTRTAWALLLLHTVTNHLVYKEAAIRNIEFALGQQAENGWFQNNCLTDPSQPLLHTIAYCIRGILEVGVLLDNRVYIEKARKAADALIPKQRRDGSLAGRFNSQWEATVPWSCLTGDAQISIIWGRLFQLTGEPSYLRCMERVNAYLMKVQLLQTNNPGIHGGISGSDPLHGAYGRFEVLNWAVKFFMDAMMLSILIRKNRV